MQIPLSIYYLVGKIFALLNIDLYLVLLQYRKQPTEDFSVEFYGCDLLSF